MMKFKFFLIFTVLAISVRAQVPAILAVANGRTFTAADLSPESRSLWEKRDQLYADSRLQLLSQMATDIVLDLEAKSKNTTSAKLIEQEIKKIADPTDEQVKAVYDANLEKLENKPLADVRKPIIEFLRRDPEQNAIKTYVDGLAAKFKISYEKDVDAADLKPAEPLFSIGGRTITAGEFENKNRLALFDTRADVLDKVKDDLESTILSSLVAADATAEKIDPQAYIAREVTNKMKQFSDGERADLENALKHRLFAKYNVKFLIGYPPTVVQKISADDDPARGPVSAPVTVVMFGDFQCSACAHTHPILQKVISEFPGKVRFVARDFPLESVHENAFIAALAASAANAQGKFFEYGEILYRNQDALDAASLKKYAVQLGLNVSQFELDFTSEKTAAEVRKDVADGKSYGINATPTIFVNGIKVRRLSAEDFREAIESALKAAGVSAIKPSTR